MKIFGLGLARTGNCSLTKAMQILGYKSMRFPLTDEDIDQNDFVCNDSVVVQYKKLDKKYPNSKFILMLRDDDEWLLSIQNYINNKPLKYLKSSRKYTRQKIYGSIQPTRSELLNSKHKHESSVKNYFEDRDTDILFINITQGEGWDKLCSFLNKPIPKIPFPSLNMARS